jgi:hypothetical protein
MDIRDEETKMQAIGVSLVIAIVVFILAVLGGI